MELGSGTVVSVHGLGKENLPDSISSRQRSVSVSSTKAGLHGPSIRHSPVLKCPQAREFLGEKLPQKVGSWAPFPGILFQSVWFVAWASAFHNRLYTLSPHLVSNVDGFKSL